MGTENLILRRVLKNTQGYKCIIFRHLVTEPTNTIKLTFHFGFKRWLKGTSTPVDFESHVPITGLRIEFTYKMVFIFHIKMTG